MCHKSCIEFAEKYIHEDDIKGRSVIEVGALDVNGSIRPSVEQFRPLSYIGVDIQKGAGVDRICPVENLIKEFGTNSFDVVISTELLEHVLNWRKAIHNLKQVLKPGGSMLLTTRSKGKCYHGYPFDYWRYGLKDIKLIFSDFEIIALCEDSEEPGVFFKAIKQKPYIESTVKGLNLYSTILDKRSSIIMAFFFWRVIIVLLYIFRVESRREHYMQRIGYYIGHPLSIGYLILRKGKNLIAHK